MPPEPIIAPASCRESKSTGRSSARFRQAAAGGPADLDGLEALAAGDAAADVEDDLAQGGAHRHFDQAGIDDFARQGEDRGAGAVGRADAGEPVRAVVDDVAHVGQRLDVVDQGRLAVQTAARPGRAGGGWACRPCLPCEAIRAVSSPQTKAPEPSKERDIEAEIAAQDVPAQQVELSWPGAGRSGAVHRQRVLGADVDVAVASARWHRRR